ncbi:MAG: ankyrin repeat domain-containing protein [Gammaproteobacteria bacterium]|nr:ankyrin repeat domain-containing protein [Gammaproteobacteria bacterium]
MPEKDRTIIFSNLFQIALRKKIKPLNEPISFQDVVAQYKPDPSSELYSNLQHACEAINAARKFVKMSTSHPSTNGLTCSENNANFERLRAIRNRKVNERYKLLLADAQFSEITSPESNQICILITLSSVLSSKLILNDCNNDGMFNCEEFATFVTIFCKSNKWGVAKYRYDIDKGDHVFNVIGATQTWDFAQQSTLNENAVVCDAWSGITFPAKYYLQNLGDFKCYDYKDRHYNFITKVNPSFNAIVRSDLVSTAYQSQISCAFDQSNYLEHLMFDIVTKLSSPREKYLYAVVIFDTVMYALKRKIITEADIKSWPDPAETLKKYFSADENCLMVLISKYAGKPDYLLEMTKLALSKGIEPNQSFKDGYNALTYCAERGLLEVAKLLLSYNINPNQATSTGANPLFMAVQCNREEIVDLLLDRKDIVIKPIMNTETAFKNFAEREGKEVVKRMQTHIANKKNQGESVNKISILPSEIAIIMGHTHLVAKLQAFEKTKTPSVVTPKTLQHTTFFQNKKDSCSLLQPIIDLKKVMLKLT